MDDWKLNFCHNVRLARKEYHMTQKELAAVLQISVSKLRRIENLDPTVRIQGKLICRFCDHFEFSADRVLRERLEEKAFPPGEALGAAAPVKNPAAFC